MKPLTPEELAFLAAWAREDREQDCWSLPAHQLQAAHKVPAISFIRLIKSWAKAAGKRDQEIYGQVVTDSPAWPWLDVAELDQRLQQLTVSPLQAAGADCITASS
jgi:hypothetical protein